MTHTTKLLHGILIISVLSIVALQTIFDVLPQGKLAGAVIIEEIPEASFDTILSGEYAKGLETQVNRELGFKPLLVRLDSQFNYSLLNHVRFTNSEVILGEGGWLYQKNYIDHKIREGDMDASSSRVFASELKTIQDYFQSRNSDIFLVVAPTKVSIYPEHLPCKIRKHFFADSQKTNFGKLRPYLLDENVNLIDGVQWFLDRKAEDPGYLLFSRGGTHWSEMGAFNFLKYAVETINQSPHVDLPPLVASSVYHAPSQGIDQDILLLINLLFPETGRDSMPYPVISKNAITDKTLPTVIIGDSFAWNVTQYLLDANVVSELDMYYYLQWIRQYRDGSQTEVPVIPIDIEAFAQPGRMVILLCNEISISNRFWGFFDQALAQIEDAEQAN